jgi:hypothetical protein
MINRILLLSVFIVFFVSIISAQSYTEANLLIDYEGLNVTDTLTVETESMLHALLKNVSTEEEIVQIEITASAENRDIGESRLAAWVQFFEKQGIGSKKLDLVTQVDDKNRVHLKIRSSFKQKTPLVEAVTEKAPEKKVAVPLAKKLYCTGASKKAEIFSIESYSNISIKGKEGTEIKISRQDLVYEDGQPVKEPIRVELKEFYKAADMLLAELHTMEGDKILETGGMLNLKITANGKALALKMGKNAKIKMPAKSAKSKKGMNLYFGKRLENGAVDWRLEERSEPIAASDDISKINEKAEFNPNSYLQVKKHSVIDSITTIKMAVNPKSVVTNNPVGFYRKSVIHSHKEDYFDLELPYLNPNIVDGVWINVDKRIEDSFAPKPVDLLVQVNGVPSKGRTVDGALISYTPKVALMLKSRAVFLRGSMISTNSSIQEQKLKFSDVPKEEEVILVAFLDIGKEVLFASESVRATKNMEVPVLSLKSMSKAAFTNAMATVAN